MKAIWTGSPEPSAKPFKQPTSTKFPKEELYGSGRILGRYFGYAESRWLA